ncbi:MAG: ATPase, partial [Treponema sp.]|nr:ATPase [Treponema sp.]
MKKVSLVILDREKESALKALRKAGLVHLEPVEGKGEKLAALKADYTALQSAAGYLGEIKLPKKTICPDLSKDEALEKAKKAIELTERKKSLFEKIAAAATEIERLSAWGSVNPADFAYLSEKGLHLKMYEVPGDKWRLIG